MAITASGLKGKIGRVYFSGLDKTLNLRFNLNSLYFLEQEYGDINKALEVVQSGKIASLIAITTALLNAGNNGKIFTEEEVANFIEMDDLEQLSKSLQDMMGVNDNKEVPSN